MRPWLLGAGGLAAAIGSGTAAVVACDAADGGACCTIGTAASDPQSFVALGFASNMTVTAVSLGLQDSAWDTAPGGSFGFHSAALGTPLSWTNLEAPVGLNFFPGSSAGEFCSEKHTWRTHGGFGDTTAYPSTTLTTGTEVSAEPVVRGEKVIMTRWIVGPIDCSGGNG